MHHMTHDTMLISHFISCNLHWALATSTAPFCHPGHFKDRMDLPAVATYTRILHAICSIGIMLTTNPCVRSTAAAAASPNLHHQRQHVKMPEDCASVLPASGCAGTAHRACPVQLGAYAIHQTAYMPLFCSSRRNAFSAAAAAIQVGCYEPSRGNRCGGDHLRI